MILSKRFVESVFDFAVDGFYKDTAVELIYATFLVIITVLFYH